MTIATFEKVGLVCLYVMLASGGACKFLCNSTADMTGHKHFSMLLNR